VDALLPAGWAAADLAVALLWLAMASIVLEALVLTAWRRRTGRGPAPADLWPNLLAGMALMAALNVALTGGGWHWVGLGLAVSGAAHLLDLRRRWGRAPR
jgi:hypothetical protein